MEQLTKDRIKMGIVILIVVTLGLFALNLWLDFAYKASLIGDPCGRCIELGNECRKSMGPIDFSNFTLSK